MKEKALRRKQMEKDQFDDKKMNLSLKEFENEPENDERYLNIEKFELNLDIIIKIKFHTILKWKIYFYFVTLITSEF